MKTKYEFVNGEVVEIEISEEWAEVLADLDRQEYNNDKKETRRHCTMDVLGDEGEWMIDENGIGSAESTMSTFGFSDERLEYALSMLNDAQREVVLAIYKDGYKACEYAEKIGVKKAAISRLLERAIKNMKEIIASM